MKYKVMLFLSLILINSCKDDEEDQAEEYIITGTVVDQVTRQPVSGASVTAGFTFCDMGDFIYPFGNNATTNADGKFKLKIKKSIFDNENYHCKFLYASKSGYAGSNIFNAPPGGALESNFELYHPAQLNLRVMNDTLANQVDSVIIWFSGEMSFSGYPNFIGGTAWDGWAKIRINCLGKDYDSTFILDKLWGNMHYTVLTTIYNGFPIPISSYGITLEPDKLNTLEIPY